MSFNDQIKINHAPAIQWSVPSCQLWGPLGQTLETTQFGIPTEKILVQILGIRQLRALSGKCCREGEHVENTAENKSSGAWGSCMILMSHSAATLH